ncbi:DUF3703 domain-containing protein [uncultured Erythrobacter sp.]|uniref:DUF3703 domain-containing protein n=1 Tax=uncultured Erythrobacter sp. TaxID=263913 RepID=UPI00260F2204|nr:DUF3703 domain-containing protein [uncultured Erythrobacter sp.]
MKNLSEHVHAELDLAGEQSDPAQRFHHLERAHILSQYATGDHVRVHLAMLRWAREQRDWREGLGQLIRIAGAATKTALGLVPVGNTGGANVSPIAPMPLPDDLAAIIARYR